MNEFSQALNHVEEWIRRIGSVCKFTKTSSPDVFCSALPSHWRSNKSLPQPFTVLILYPVPDGTKITVAAGNEENACADIKNNIAEVTQQMARFSDLRFVGKSGRGKNFNLTITIHTAPIKEVIMATNIIKVTVDGPRDSRNPNKTICDRKRPGLPFDPAALGFPFMAKQPRFCPPLLPMLPPNLSTMVPPPMPISSALQETFMTAAAMSLCNQNFGNLMNNPMFSNEMLFAQFAASLNNPANKLHALNTLTDFYQKKSSNSNSSKTEVKESKEKEIIKVSTSSVKLEDSGTPTSSSEANDSIENKLPRSRHTPDLNRIKKKTSLENTQDLIHVDVETTTDDECNTSSTSTTSSSLQEPSPSLLKKEKNTTTVLWRPFSPKTETVCTSE